MRKLRLQETPCSRRQLAGLGLGSVWLQIQTPLLVPLLAWGLLAPQSEVPPQVPGDGWETSPKLLLESDTGQEESVPRDGGQ